MSERHHINEGANMKQCPCGSGESYQHCCGSFIDGGKKPATPEALMRSRYTAYTQANIPYIMQTMKSPASDGYDAESALAWAKQVTWQKLEVVKSTQDGAKGFVEFIAYFKDQKENQAMHELSEFHLIDDAWFYVDGQLPDDDQCC